jgi:hypothetical protein
MERDKMKTDNKSRGTIEVLAWTFKICIALMVTTLFIVACARRVANPEIATSSRSDSANVSRVWNPTALAIWRSTNATPVERAKAVNRLLTEGTSVATVMSLLGSDAAITRDHGPSVALNDRDRGVVPARAFHEKIWLEYEVPGGAVSLSFGAQSGVIGGWGFERAIALDSPAGTDP